MKNLKNNIKNLKKIKWTNIGHYNKKSWDIIYKEIHKFINNINIVKYD